MRRLFTLRNLARGVGIILGLAVLVIGVWMTIAGPVTVARILRYGDTDIDDFSHYPGRELQASESPSPFEEAATPLSIQPDDLRQFGEDGQLDAILEANDSIAFIVIRDDQIVYERYLQGHTQSAPSQAFSMSKSFLSALIGMAIEDGILGGVDQPLVSVVPELSDQRLDQVTIRDLLTMTSGSDYIENDNPFQEHVILNYTPRLEDRILAIKRETDPGEVFRYKSGDNALLALMLDRALGAETITDYTQRRLWNPLGMEYDGIWTIDHADDGLEKTWCCLAAAARDFAKLGKLYLHEGRWNGEQILPADWIAASTTPAIPMDSWPADFAEIGLSNYGYQWWLTSEEDGDYLALGKDGQYVYVNPARDVVIVRLGWSRGELFTSGWLSLFQTIAREN